MGGDDELDDLVDLQPDPLPPAAVDEGAHSGEQTLLLIGVQVAPQGDVDVEQSGPRVSGRLPGV